MANHKSLVLGYMVFIDASSNPRSYNTRKRALHAHMAITMYVSVGQYQYFTSGIQYCKFKMVFSIPWYFDQTQLTSYSWLTMCLVSKHGRHYME